jgi:hypothetical protein
LQALRLTAIEDRLNDVRREQRQPQQAVDEAARNLLRFCDLRRRSVFPSSSKRFQRCARVSARISVSSGRGFAGTQASPPSGRTGSMAVEPSWGVQHRYNRLRR